MSSPPDASSGAVRTLFTIGYEGATVATFLESLTEAGVTLLVDVRAVAMSRRPGFAKTRLQANLHEAGIDYIHMKRLGTPSDGRAAARAGRHHEMRRVFLAYLATEGAQEELEALAELVQTSGRRICLMCFESDPGHCHRSMVAQALIESIGLEVVNLHAMADPD